MRVDPPRPTCPWPTEGESWVWDCHAKKPPVAQKKAKGKRAERAPKAGR